MMDLYSNDHILTLVPGMTPERLFAFLEARLVIPTVEPTASASIQLFTPLDVARLRFLCELVDDLDLDERTLSVVMALLDKLHAARHDLRCLACAIEAEPADVRTRIGLALTRLKS